MASGLLQTACAESLEQSFPEACESAVSVHTRHRERHQCIARRYQARRTAVLITLNQHVIHMQVDRSAGHQEAILWIARPGQPKTATGHFEVKAFRRVDNAGLSWP